MRKILQYFFKRPLTWLVNHYSASPKQEMVFNSLSQLLLQGQKEKGTDVKILEMDIETGRFIIFSDQHKGNKSWADDFNKSEPNYLAALQYYNQLGFTFINLGDSEEIWKFKTTDILSANVKALAAEAAFHPHRYVKTFGNHDLLWKNKLDVMFLLKKYFSMPLPVYEAVLLKVKNGPSLLNIFLTHGHQGDLMSDNNSLSTWLVAHVWMPVQRYLRININSPSKDFSLRNKHNKMMYEWSLKQKDLLLITGHTHKPVFASGRYLNHPGNKIHTNEMQQDLSPCYFNTGCCCFNDGDITGIEIADGVIRLIKWYDKETSPKKKTLEEISLKLLMKDLV